MRFTSRLRLAGAVLIGFCVSSTSAADWPTYRHDARRSGVTAERIAAPLSSDWAFTATHPPVHAWGDPQPKPVEKVLELPRMRFDDVFHVAAAGGMVFFGSSSEDKLYALDAGTGRIRWEFFTGGPVRLAPTVAGGRVYVGSDDGKVYCLNAADGRVAWSFSAAPTGRKLLGNGRMISVWPVRTGVVVDDGVAYFGAGVWPAEGLYLYAVDAATGKLLWKNDTYGAGGMANLAPQGHLAVSAERLLMPAGRVMPAGFDRKTGRYLYQRNLSWRLTGLFGGSHVQFAGKLAFTGAEQVVAMYEDSGYLALTESLPPRTPSTGLRRLVVSDAGLYLLTGKELIGADRDRWLSVQTNITQRTLQISSLGRSRSRVVGNIRELDKPRQAEKKKTGKLPPESPAYKKLVQQKKDLEAQIAKLGAERKAWQKKRDEPIKWRADFAGSDELILAGETLFAGGPDVVTAFDADGKQLWSAKVNGRARSLAVAGGRLLVSTDKGSIHCFVPGGAGAGRKIAPKIATEPFGDDERTKRCAAEAERIVKATGVRRGYALILGEPTGRLAYELARRTELKITVVAADAKEVAAARKALSAAGVYGVKVVVMASPGGALPFSDYFANLIVCGPELAVAKEMPSAAEVYRMLKPCGGVLTVTPPADNLAGAAAAKLAAWRKELARVSGEKKAAGTDAVEITRGPLAGAGGWTHQYGEPGNTCCSDDQRVKGALGMLWYGAPGPGRMANRHASAAAPLAFGGRMFVQGEEVVMAYDAYNGVLLWQREIQGAIRLGLKSRASNLAADAKSLYVAVGDQCFRLDAATGKTLATCKVPPDAKGKSGNWRYVAATDGLLFGSRDNHCVFAVEPATGKQRWAHEGRNIEPRTICVGGGRVYFIDKTATAAQKAEALKGVKPPDRLDRRGKPIGADVRLVVALNAQTGKLEWQRPQYVSDCVKVGGAGGDLTVMYAHNVLLLCGQPWNGHFWRDFMAGKFSRRSLIALSAYSGEPIWSGRKGYRSRPLIVGGRIVAEPWAYDIQTGIACRRTDPITGASDKWQMARPGHHCGNIAGAPNALFFRSGTLAYYDLLADHGTAHLGGHRPGCWVNCIPANGLVIMPEASSGCICPFALHCTTVYQPKRRRRTWGMYSKPAAALPVRHLAVNFGAPGDRKAADGTLWLAYPRPRSYTKDYDQRLVMDFHLGLTPTGKKVEYRRANVDFLKLAGTGEPWVYGSACEGLAKCTIPLQPAGSKQRDYTVRLHFVEMGRAAPGERVFDVAVRGKKLLAGLDVAAAAGGPRKVVIKELKHVRAGEALELAFTPRKGTAALCGVEVIREGD